MLEAAGNVMDLSQNDQRTTTALWWVILACVCIVVVVGVVDYLTGFEVLLFRCSIWRRWWLKRDVASGQRIRADDFLLECGGVDRRRFRGGGALSQFVCADLECWHSGNFLWRRLLVAGRPSHVAGKARLELEGATTHPRVDGTNGGAGAIGKGDFGNQRGGNDDALGTTFMTSLCQHLTATALAGQVLTQKLINHAAPEGPEARHVVRLIEDGLTMARNVARGLHPVEVDAEGLMEAFSEPERRPSTRRAKWNVFLSAKEGAGVGGARGHGHRH